MWKTLYLFNFLYEAVDVGLVVLNGLDFNIYFFNRGDGCRVISREDIAYLAERKLGELSYNVDAYVARVCDIVGSLLGLNVLGCNAVFFCNRGDDSLDHRVGRNVTWVNDGDDLVDLCTGYLLSGKGRDSKEPLENSLNLSDVVVKAVCHVINKLV